MNEAKFHIGVKALIMNEQNEILLLKAGSDEKKHNIEFWDFPGGRIKEGHNIEETLRREVEEELGIMGNEIEIRQLFDATISNFKGLREDGTLLMLLVYICKLHDIRNFKLCDEHSEWRFVPIDEAKKLLAVKFRKSFTGKLDSLKK